MWKCVNVEMWKLATAKLGIKTHYADTHKEFSHFHISTFSHRFHISTLAHFHIAFTFPH